MKTADESGKGYKAQSRGRCAPRRLLTPIGTGLLVFAVLACSSPSSTRPTARSSDGSAAAKPAAPSRTLVLATRAEPDSLAEKPLARVAGGGESEIPRMFNAGLAIDDQGLARAYLAEALPQLNTDTWRVLPDGTMETIYRLRPGLTWHDGQPLHAEDFVFAWRVFQTPEYALSGSPPINKMDEVAARDERTVLIRWSGAYPDAAGLRGVDFPPLPRHILAEDFQANQSTLASHPFWTTGYVGLGPYRIDDWRQGASLDSVAFGGHVWGPPRIDRVVVRFIADSNAVLASLLSGEVHLSIRSAIEVPQGVYLRGEWAQRSGGSVLIIPSYWRRGDLQHRPEYVSPASMVDVRVRRAIAHAIDRQALNQGVFEGEAIIADSVIPPFVPYFADAERAIAKYPYDPRRSESLMGEAGWIKGPDGVFANATGRFSLDLRVNASLEGGTELAITGDGLRQAGFDVQEVAVPRALQRDGQLRSTFSAIYLGGGGLGEKDTMPNMVSSTIPSPLNHWAGGNRGGWSNTEFDRLFNAYNTTLVRSERDQLVVQMAKVHTEDVGAISLLFYPSVVAHVADLRGPRTYAGTSTVVWNLHEWEWTAG